MGEVLTWNVGGVLTGELSDFWKLGGFKLVRTEGLFLWGLNPSDWYLTKQLHIQKSHTEIIVKEEKSLTQNFSECSIKKKGKI